jgi:hypothetical protein
MEHAEPIWAPAEQYVPHLVDDLMYMGNAPSYGGHVIRQYKHYFTRNYINLDDSGQAWDLEFIWNGLDAPRDVTARKITLTEAVAALDLYPGGYTDL